MIDHPETTEVQDIPETTEVQDIPETIDDNDRDINYRNLC